MSLKVTAAKAQNIQSKAPKKLTQEEIAQKIASKFGPKSEIKKAAPANVSKGDSVEINSKETMAHGDIGKNDPNSELTREKLRGLLKGGGFQFNDKERNALAQILK